MNPWRKPMDFHLKNSILLITDFSSVNLPALNKHLTFQSSSRPRSFWQSWLLVMLLLPWCWMKCPGYLPKSAVRWMSRLALSSCFTCLIVGEEHWWFMEIDLLSSRFTKYHKSLFYEIDLNITCLSEEYDVFSKEQVRYCCTSSQRFQRPSSSLCHLAMNPSTQPL